MYLLFIIYMARYVMVLTSEAGRIHYEGHWKGWALEIKTFLGPEMATTKRMIFGPKKVKLFCIGMQIWKVLTTFLYAVFFPA